MGTVLSLIVVDHGVWVVAAQSLPSRVSAPNRATRTSNTSTARAKIIRPISTATTYFLGRNTILQKEANRGLPICQIDSKVSGASSQSLLD
jgi:hypothetical protein